MTVSNLYKVAVFIAPYMLVGAMPITIVYIGMRCGYPQINEWHMAIFIFSIVLFRHFKIIS